MVIRAWEGGMKDVISVSVEEFQMHVVQNSNDVRDSDESSSQALISAALLSF